MTALAHAGATVAATGPDVLTITGIAAQDVVAALAGSGVPFSEVSAHRASLEEAYMDLTRDAVEFRAEDPAVGSAGPATSEQEAAR
jgi:ABC-2 type transport system ATP-binding protein